MKYNYQNCLIAAAIGDICGSVYEFKREKPQVIELMRSDVVFTDDTVCTFAVAEALLHNLDISDNLAHRCLMHRNAGYGGMFRKWIALPKEQRTPYNSFGNGSAMRCSAAGWMANSEDEVMELAKKTAECTHNHPEGIKGAQAIAMGVYYGKTGMSKDYIRKNVLDKFYPEWSDVTLEKLIPTYKFEVSCQKSVPVAIICFLESENYKDCIHKCIETGGDVDTIGAMAGPIAYAYYGEMPADFIDRAKSMLPEWMLKVNEEFDAVVK